MVGLAISILLHLMNAALGYSKIRLLSKGLTEQVILAEDLFAIATKQEIIEASQLAVYLLGAVCFLIWIYLTHKNLPALGIRRPRYSPARAVIWFLVPVLNLFGGYDVVRELWKESNPDAGISDAFLKQHGSTLTQYSSKTVLIGFWWGFLIASAIVGRTSFTLRSAAHGMDDLLTASWVEIISYALFIVATVVAIFIVKEIDARQEEKHRRFTLSNRVEVSSEG
jgi:hypothetical protein